MERKFEVIGEALNQLAKLDQGGSGIAGRVGAMLGGSPDFTIETSPAPGSVWL